MFYCVTLYNPVQCQKGLNTEKHNYGIPTYKKRVVTE